jgi:hypothetical protein
VSQHLIEYVARDRTGITAVVTETGVVDADTVIRNIRAGHSGYAVARGEWHRVPVRIPTALGVPYLFANWDGSKRNNLHDLAFRAPTRPVSTVHDARSAGVFRALAAGFAAVLRRVGTRL